ncbi:MAG: hypothetical protein R3C19_27260 [Planctomycetaceae bacterium]
MTYQPVDLDAALLHWAEDGGRPCESWTLRDAFAGCAVFGATGSWQDERQR